MRRIWILILLLAVSCQQTTVNGQQTLCTVPEPVEGTTLGASTSSATAYPRNVDCCPLSVDHHENQIRLADSLYKNYLPQYNFDEVKAAMEFFDSLRLSMDNGDGYGYGNNIPLPTPTFDSNIRLQNPIFLCAKAHYYHAVGLTEKDDIVGACEHYLIALEIMEEMMAKDKRRKAKGKEKAHGSQPEAHSSKKSVDRCPLSVDHLEDYEKIRFLSLIHTRLGEIFLNENYCDLAIISYKNALYYSDIIKNNLSIARALKCIGNSFQLLDQADSALYYYNKSLKTNNDLSNKLDIDKCIAQIMYSNKGERDSAYFLLKRNFETLYNDNVKYAYHYTLGNMFYIDKAYDSALYYLEKSLDDRIVTKKLAFTTRLSAIYDSLGNHEKKAYYDNLSSKLFINSTNKEIDRSKLQALYGEYNERKQKKAELITKKRAIILCGFIIIIIVSSFIMIRFKHKRHSDKLSEEIMAKDNYIKQNEFKNALIEGKIKSKNAELQQKDKQIKSQQLKIDELQSRLENRKDNLKEYYQSEICVKILNNINELSKSQKDTSCLEPLCQEEFVMLLQSANLHLVEFIKNISGRYPSFKKEDFYYLCLVILNLNDRQIAALFNVTYNAIRSRRKKICTLLDIDINENIYKKLLV